METDAWLPTPTGSLPITRHYHSSLLDDTLGFGWSLGFAWQVHRIDPEHRLVTGPVGAWTFRGDREGGYLGPEGAILIVDESASRLALPGAAMIAFDAEGRERLREDANGNRIRIARDPQGRITDVASGPEATFKFSYDADGRLRSLTDGHGRRVEYRYDERNLLSGVVDIDGRTLAYGYDSVGRLESVEYPDERREEYRHDDLGRLSERVHADGRTEWFAYDGRTLQGSDSRGDEWAQAHDDEGRPLWRTDASGTRESWVWNDAGQLLERTYPDGSSVRLSYDRDGRLLSQEASTGTYQWFDYDAPGGRLRALDADGALTRIEYDARGNVSRIVSPAGRPITLEADAHGRPALIVDGLGHEQRLDFGPHGLLERLEAPDGAVTRWEFDAHGRLIREWDALDQVTRYQYREDGLLDSVAAPGQPVTRFEYDAAGRLVAEVAVGQRTEYAYDQAGNLVRIRHADETEDRYTFAPGGHLTRHTDRLGNTTRWHHDSQGRLTAMEFPSGLLARLERPAPGSLRVLLGLARTEIHRSPDGRELRIRDAAGQETTRELDTAGRTVRQTLPSGKQERRRYDADGFLTDVITPAGDRWAFEHGGSGLLEATRYPDGSARRYGYDSSGRLARVDLPWGAQVQWEYDGLGRVTRQVNARSQELYFTYDPAGRLVEKQTPDETWSHRYGPAGELLESGNGVLTLRYGRDRHGRLNSVEYVEWEQTIEWRRDALGRIVERVGPGDFSVRYRYDRLGRPVGQEISTGLQMSLAYDPLGRLTSTHIAERGTTAFAYDTLDRVLAVDHRTASGERLSRHYGYDVDGNVVSIAGTEIGALDLRYDADDQLVAVANEEIREAFAYGPGNRRRSALHAGTEHAYAFDEGGRLTQAGPTRYTYDADGNRLTRSDTDGTSQYRYDAEGRLIAVALPDGRSVGYGYGPQGERIWREIDGVRSHFVYDGDDLIAELDAQFQPLAFYLYTGTDRPWAVLRPDALRFYHLDAHNNVIALSDEDGRIRTRYQRDAFGALRAWSGEDDPQPLGYAGRPHDPATGLIDMRARWLDPELGLFLGPDPLLGDPEDPLSLLPYTYARNNPYRYADTTGLTSHPYDPFPEALRGNPPPPPPVYRPGHTETHDANHYYHEIARGVYRNVQAQAREAERAAQEQARLQRMQNPEPGFDNATVRVTPAQMAARHSRHQAVSFGQRLLASARAAGERVGAAWNRAGETVRAGIARADAVAQPYAADAQRLSTVTGRGLIAIRIGDVLGEAVAADDPTRVLADCALDLAGYAVTSAALGQATAWATASLPALATVGGAAIGTTALTTAALERVAAAAEERGQQWLAEQRAEWAEQLARDTTRGIQEDRARHLEILRLRAAELQRLRGVLQAQLAEAAALELEAANQRNVALARADRADALRARIREHEAAMSALRAHALPGDIDGLQAQVFAVEALAEQACADAPNALALADRVSELVRAIAVAGQVAARTDALDRWEAGSAMAAGFVSEAEDMKADLDSRRRAIEQRLGIIEGLAGEYPETLNHARSLQASISGSTQRLRLFLDGPDLATLEAVRRDAAAPLPSDDALFDAVHGARESLAAVDVERLLGGTISDAQAHAGGESALLELARQQQARAQELVMRGRGADSRARSCADGSIHPPAPPDDPNGGAAEIAPPPVPRVLPEPTPAPALPSFSVMGELRGAVVPGACSQQPTRSGIESYIRLFHPYGQGLGGEVQLRLTCRIRGKALGDLSPRTYEVEAPVLLQVSGTFDPLTATFSGVATSNLAGRRRHASFWSNGSTISVFGITDELWVALETALSPLDDPIPLSAKMAGDRLVGIIGNAGFDLHLR